MSAFVWQQQGRMSVTPTSVPVLSLLCLDGESLHRTVSKNPRSLVGGCGASKKEMKSKTVMCDGYTVRGRKDVCGRIGVMKRPVDYNTGNSEGEGGIVELSVPWYS